MWNDTRGINKDATMVRFVYKLTLSDGHVKPFEVIWNKATYDRLDSWAGEDECFIHYLNPLNREKALLSAEKKWDYLEKVAKTLARQELADDHQRMWSEKQRMLISKAEKITQFNSIQNATNRDVGKALCNGAMALANVRVGHGIDFSGKSGTQVSGPHGMGFPRHSSTAIVSHSQHCEGNHPESDQRRNRKGRATRCDRLLEAQQEAEREAEQEAAAEAARLAAAERVREAAAQEAAQEAARVAAASIAREEAVALAAALAVATAKADALERRATADGGSSSGAAGPGSEASEAAVPDQFMCSITAEIMTDPVNTVCRTLP